ncbi:hypothetical protein WA026_019427 [Henosepilachna vigintioctopunctata]|uniref:Uncharacterized protein n=1 Tax=Henosepilachna vigintioctopunctata TaxID=420089 RepID=A0AAW1UAL5_9CUCU
MFSGGIGSMEANMTDELPPQKGHQIVKIGGPVYRIGVGGGSASSVEVQGDNKAELDFNAVQRGTAKTRKARLQHSAPTVRDPTQPTSMVYVQYLEKTRKTDNKKEKVNRMQIGSTEAISIDKLNFSSLPNQHLKKTESKLNYSQAIKKNMEIIGKMPM